MRFGHTTEFFEKAESFKRWRELTKRRCRGSRERAEKRRRTEIAERIMALRREQKWMEESLEH